MNTVLALTLVLSQQGSTVEDKQRYSDPGSAILAGRWERAKELLAEIRAAKTGLGDGSMASLMDGGRIGADNYYANILTGIRLYKEAGASPNEANGKALYLAAEGDKYGQITERLLQYGADPNHRFYHPEGIAKKFGGIPPLGVVYYEVPAKNLLKYHAKPDVFFPFNRNEELTIYQVTPLMRTVILKGAHKVTSLLLQNKANPNLKCPENGMTALHFAAKYNYDDVIPMLLKAKADKSLKDKNGRTPLAVARKYKSLKAIKALGGR